MTLSRDAVLAALKTVDDPVAGGDIVSSGVMRALNVSEDGAVRFVLEIAPKHAQTYDAVKTRAEEVLGALPGVASVSIVLTGHTEKAPPPDLKPQRAAEPKRHPQSGVYLYSRGRRYC